MDYQPHEVQEQPTGVYTKVINFLVIQNKHKKSRTSQKSGIKGNATQEEEELDTGEDLTTKSPKFVSVDLDLGVPSDFNPNDLRLSLEQKNIQLSESIYDFIF